MIRKKYVISVIVKLIFANDSLRIFKLETEANDIYHAFNFACNDVFARYVPMDVEIIEIKVQLIP